MRKIPDSTARNITPNPASSLPTITDCHCLVMFVTWGRTEGVPNIQRLFTATFMKLDSLFNPGWGIAWRHEVGLD